MLEPFAVSAAALLFIAFCTTYWEAKFWLIWYFLLYVVLFYLH